jgi:hypothetical protein
MFLIRSYGTRQEHIMTRHTGTGTLPGNAALSRNATLSRNNGDDQQVQAAFDFMPAEMRQRLRFGDVLRAGKADMRNQSWMIDRQVVGLGSRIAAARLREILRPASENPASVKGSLALGTDVLAQSPAETQILTQPTMVSRDLVQQREILREIGTAVFYFRDEHETPPEEAVQTQRLHPRALPARYYGAPPQQAGGNATQDNWASTSSERKSA